MSAKWSLAALIGVGMIAAMCAAVLVAGSRAGKGNKPAGPPPEIEIAVAAAALPAGKVIEQGDVESQSVPVSDAAMGSVPASQAIGKVLATPMVKGQAFNSESFATESTGMRVATAIPQGMRAVSVALSKHSGLKGLVYPGSIVDVVASFRIRSEGSLQSEAVSVTLLQAIQVLAIDSKTVLSEEEDDSKGSSKMTYDRSLIVTLMLNSAQAEALALATEHGTITLALRNPLDAEDIEDSDRDLSTLIGLIDGFGDEPEQAPPVVAAAAPAPPAPVAPPAQPVKVAQEPEPQEPPTWEVAVIRGENVKSFAFSMPINEMEGPAPSAGSAIALRTAAQAVPADQNSAGQGHWKDERHEPTRMGTGSGHSNSFGISGAGPD